MIKFFYLYKTWEIYIIQYITQYITQYYNQGLKILLIPDLNQPKR